MFFQLMSIIDQARLAAWRDRTVPHPGRPVITTTEYTARRQKVAEKIRFTRPELN